MEEPIKTEPDKETDGETIETGRDVQAPEKEIAFAAAKTSATQSVNLLKTSVESGKRIERKEINTLIKKINDYIKEAKPRLTNADYRSVLRKVQSMTKLTTEKKIEKAEQILDFIEKRDIAGGKREKTAIELQEYDNAKAIRKSAIKTIKNKRIVFGNRSMEAINAIRQIDIQDLTPEQIRQYNEALSEVVAPKLKPTPETINAFFDKIRQIDYTPAEKKIGDVKSIEEYIDAVTAMEINNSVEFLLP